MALPIGIATVNATMARMRRSSLTASRRSRCATRTALRRPRLGQLTLMLVPMVAHDGQVYVLQARPVQCGADQRDLLPHALGVAAQPAIGRVAELEELEQGLDPPGSNLRWKIVDRAEIVEVSAGRHPLVQAGQLRHEAHALAHRR